MNTASSSKSFIMILLYIWMLANSEKHFKCAVRIMAKKVLAWCQVDGDLLILSPTVSSCKHCVMFRAIAMELTCKMANDSLFCSRFIYFSLSLPLFPPPFSSASFYLSLPLFPSLFSPRPSLSPSPPHFLTLCPNRSRTKKKLVCELSLTNWKCWQFRCH